MDEWLELFWNDLLSEQPAQILAAWSRIDAESRASVYAHLQRMVSEDGWADAQRDSARAALQTLDDMKDSDSAHQI